MKFTRFLILSSEEFGSDKVDLVVEKNRWLRVKGEGGGDKVVGLNTYTTDIFDHLCCFSLLFPSYGMLPFSCILNERSGGVSRD